jgi:regulator of protease activity HflC (stomatin/prohibitin superfamily)
LLHEDERMTPAVLGVVVIVALILVMAAIRIVQEYERGVIFRLGRVVAGAKARDCSSSSP